MRDMIRDLCVINASDIIRSIKFVAEHLESENHGLSNEARRIRKNLEKYTKDEKSYPILNKDFSPINFSNYIERLKHKKDLDSINEELKGPFYLAYNFLID